MTDLIQHADVNVGPSSYRELAKDELLVTKIFYTYPPIKDAVFRRANALKFVISGDPTSPYHSLPPYATAKDPDEVFLSPLTVYRYPARPGEVVSAWDTVLVDHQAIEPNYRRAAQLALKHGYRVSTQQHLFFGVE